MSSGSKCEPSLETTRVFVALPLAPEATRHLEMIQTDLLAQAELKRVPLRLTPHHQFHVTLAFMGNISRSQLQRVVRVASNVFLSHAAFGLVLEGLVVFPSPRRARVLGAALEDPSGALCPAVASLHTGLRHEGLVLEERAFRPHVTLARVQPPAHVEFEASQTWLSKSTLLCRTVAVYESVFDQRGTRYAVLQSVSLD